MECTSQDRALLRDARFFMGSDVLLDPSARSTRNKISLNERNLKSNSILIAEEESLNTEKKKRGRPFGIKNVNKKLKMTSHSGTPSNSFNNINALTKASTLITLKLSSNRPANRPWSMVELIDLKRIITEFDAIGFERDWDTVAFELRTDRTALEVREKWNSYKGKDAESDKVPEKVSLPTLQNNTKHIGAVKARPPSIPSKTSFEIVFPTPRRAIKPAPTSVLSPSRPSHTPNTSFRPFTSSITATPTSDIPHLQPVPLALSSNTGPSGTSLSSSSSANISKVNNLAKKVTLAQGIGPNNTKKNTALEDWDF